MGVPGEQGESSKGEAGVAEIYVRFDVTDLEAACGTVSLTVARLN